MNYKHLTNECCASVYLSLALPLRCSHISVLSDTDLCVVYSRGRELSLQKHHITHTHITWHIFITLLLLDVLQLCNRFLFISTMNISKTLIGNAIPKNNIQFFRDSFSIRFIPQKCHFFSSILTVFQVDLENFVYSFDTSTSSSLPNLLGSVLFWTRIRE